MQKYADISCKLLQGKSEKKNPCNSGNNLPVPASEYIEVIYVKEINMQYQRMVQKCT